MKTQRKKIEKIQTSSEMTFNAVHVGSRMEIFPSDIIMISADISYSFIHLSDGKRIIVSTNIQKLEERLLPFRNMVRVHRSYMINTEFLNSSTETTAFLKNDLSCTISRRKKINLENALKN